MRQKRTLNADEARPVDLPLIQAVFGTGSRSWPGVLRLPLRLALGRVVDGDQDECKLRDGDRQHEPGDRSVAVPEVGPPPGFLRMNSMNKPPRMTCTAKARGLIVMEKLLTKPPHWSSSGGMSSGRVSRLAIRWLAFGDKSRRMPPLPIWSPDRSRHLIKEMPVCCNTWPSTSNRHARRALSAA